MTTAQERGQMVMKALTLTQPWATLVAIGAKRIETRSWRTAYRGPLAIHAAKSWPREALAFASSQACSEAFKSRGAMYWFARGSVVATCNLVECLPMQASGCLPGIFDDCPELDTPEERAFGDYSAGRWAWILEEVKSLDHPIPAKGALGLWEWNP